MATLELQRGVRYLYPAGLTHVVHKTEIKTATTPIKLSEDNDMLFNMLADGDYNLKLVVPAAELGLYFKLPQDHELMIYMDGDHVTARLIKWLEFDDYTEISLISKPIAEAQTPIQNYLYEVSKELFLHAFTKMIKSHGGIVERILQDQSARRASMAKPNHPTHLQC